MPVDPISNSAPAFASESLTDADVQMPQPKPLAVVASKPKPGVAMPAEPIEPGAPIASAGATAPATVAVPKPGGLPRLAEKANVHDAQGHLEAPQDQPSGGSGQVPVANASEANSPSGGPSPQTIEALVRPAHAKQPGVGPECNGQRRLYARRAGGCRWKRP